MSQQPRRDRRPGPPEQAGAGRRLIGLTLDWLVAVAISAGFFRYEPLATLAVFFAMTWVLVGTVGATIGHRLAGIGVRRLDLGPPGLGRAAARAAALCLVVPAVVWGADGRGLHDRWAGTQIIRLA